MLSTIVQQRIKALLAVVSQVVRVPWVDIYVPQPGWQFFFSELPPSAQANAANMRQRVLSAGRILLIEDVQQLADLQRDSGDTTGAGAHTRIQFYGGFPIGHFPQIVGVLSVMADAPLTATAEQKLALAVLADQISDLLIPVLAAPSPAIALVSPSPEAASFRALYQSVMRLSMGLQRCLSFEDLSNQLITRLPQELPLQAFELTAHLHSRVVQQICLWPTTMTQVPHNDELICRIPYHYSDSPVEQPLPISNLPAPLSAAGSDPLLPDSDVSLWQCYQLKVQNYNVGTLKICLQASALSSFHEDSEVFTNLADQIGVTLHRLILLRKLQAENLQDPLTQLFNRRHLMGVLGKLMKRVSYGHYQVGFIMLDLDHFKSLNDTYGHDAGDQVLRMVGVFLKGHARPNDVVCRFGGEEFALILPGLTWEILERRASQICRGMHYLNCKAGDTTLQVTLSAGFAIAPLHGKTPSTLIKAADEALYAAKRQGRDRIVGASLPAASAASTSVDAP